MPVGDHALADLPVGHVLPDLDDDAGELMTTDGVEPLRGVRSLEIRIPVLHVGTANGSGLDADDHVIGAALGCRDVDIVVAAELTMIAVTG